MGGKKIQAKGTFLRKWRKWRKRVEERAQVEENEDKNRQGKKRRSESTEHCWWRLVTAEGH
jgi:hypothetical protein